MTAKLLSLVAALALLCTTTTGCAALIDAGIKEGFDHGDNARYENKSYGDHFLDSLLEDDDDDECHRTTVVVTHGG